MEDDEKIPSAATGSPPVSPRSNGRITVTVAAAGQPLQNSLTRALPLQKPRNGGGRDDCWSEGATAVLIEAWGERYLELSRGNLKQKHWKEVADIISSREDYTKIPKTDVQCKNRIDTVKKKYKLEKSKSAAGGGPSKWPFFERLEHLIGPTAKISANAANSSKYPSASSSYRVPVGIPVGVRSENHIDNKNKQQQQKVQNKNQKQKIQIQRRSPVEEAESEAQQDSADSFPPATIVRKRPRSQSQRGLNSNAAAAREREKGKGNLGVGELTAAILKFGEAYERAERLKVQQAVEMEKKRMKFGKEVELQRMQFCMKTHLEISRLRHGRKSSHHSISNNTNSGSSN